ncbi:MAG TPA: tryptophan synthase subunit alpha [Chloroflexota bacterium]|nr:tryptophan synthase subunit alpha [Chloroflexota bacterium]
MTRIARTFERLRHERACGLFPFLAAGFPDVETSHALAEAALEAGADGFEIGVPFSDPLADGATHQRIYARALAGGATLDTALDLARVIRRRSPETPVALMSYYNPLRQRGDALLAAQLAEIGADAAIVPDLPPEEAGEFGTALLAQGLGLVPMLAPTSPAARIRAVAALDPVWIYCVALVGVTGARQSLAIDLADFLDNVRAATSAPLVVGFGISQPDHVRRVARLGAAGVIVGSALSDLVDRSADPVAAARAYLTELKLAAAGALAR